MIASLPMYAMPHTAAAEERFWASIRDGLRDAGIAAPDRLIYDVPDLLAHWLSPNLILSQTCSLPYRSKLRPHVTLIGTPDYGVDGCVPGHYCSLIIAREDDPRDDLDGFKGSRFALNDALSQSGWAAAVVEHTWILDCPKRLTGSHRASALAVAAGHADFAAIDAITFRHLTRAGETKGLRVLAETQPTPGLPLIAAKGLDADVIFGCIDAALSQLDTIDRETLGLRGIVLLPPAAYDLPIPPAPRAIAV